MSKVVKLQVKDIKFDFDVRRLGNDLDHIKQMAAFLESGGTLPPIIVNERYGLVEGRQRLEAHKILKRTEIDAVVQSFENKAEERFVAMKHQLGLGLPLSSEDIRWNIKQMLLSRVSRDVIIKNLSGVLTRPLVIRYMDDAMSSINKDRIQKGLDRVADGETIGEIVRDGLVSAEQLKKAILHRKEQAGKVEPNAIKAAMGAQIRSLSRAVEKQKKDVLRSFDDNLLTATDALRIAEHTLNLIEALHRRAEDSLIRLKQVAR